MPLEFTASFKTVLHQLIQKIRRRGKRDQAAPDIARRQDAEKIAQFPGRPPIIAHADHGHRMNAGQGFKPGKHREKPRAAAHRRAPQGHVFSPPPPPPPPAPPPPPPLRLGGGAPPQSSAAGFPSKS